MATDQHQAEGPTFLHIPLEVRQQIYKAVAAGDQTLYAFRYKTRSKQGKNERKRNNYAPVTYLQLLVLNRQIRAEALPYLSLPTSLELIGPSRSRFATFIPTKLLANITTLSLDMSHWKAHQYGDCGISSLGVKDLPNVSNVEIHNVQGHVSTLGIWGLFASEYVVVRQALSGIRLVDLLWQPQQELEVRARCLVDSCRYCSLFAPVVVQIVVQLSFGMTTSNLRFKYACEGCLQKREKILARLDKVKAELKNVKDGVAEAAEKLAKPEHLPAQVAQVAKVAEDLARLRGNKAKANVTQGRAKQEKASWSGHSDAT